MTKPMTLLMATVDTLPRPYEVITLLHTVSNANLKMSLRNPAANASEDALRALNEQAISIGADGVIGLRFTMVGPGQLLVSGTAIKFTEG